MPCPYTLRPFDFAAQGMPLRLYLLSFVLLCLKVFSICANFQAAKAVSFSVFAWRAANNAVMTFRPFSVTI
jgi:hypothetical protein